MICIDESKPTMSAGAMDIYDMLKPLGLRPDDALNQVLVRVCRIDPSSVAWNAR